MSADHRKPLVAFVVLAFAAAAIVGIQRAEAQAGRFLAAVVGTSVRVQGTLSSDDGPVEAAIRAAGLGPAFSSLDRVLRGGVTEPFETAPVEAAVAHRVAEPGLPAETAGRGRAASTAAAEGNGRGRGHGRGIEAATEHGKTAGSVKAAEGKSGQAGKRGDATPARPRTTARHTARERVPDPDGAGRAAHEPAGLGNGRPGWVERASREADRRRPGQRGWVRAVHTAPGGSAR